MEKSNTPQIQIIKGRAQLKQKLEKEKTTK
jgi:hypothetical protein